MKVHIRAKVFAVVETQEGPETRSSTILGIFSTEDKGDFFLDSYINKMYPTARAMVDGYSLENPSGETHFRLKPFEVQ